MASISRREVSGKPRYDVNYREPDGTRRRRTFRKRVDADRFAATVEADKVRGTYIDTSDQTTLTEYARRWAAARPHRPTTAKRTTSIIENHIVGTRLGGRRLAAVLPSEVQAWASDRALVLAPSTLRGLVSLLRSIYASAVHDRLVASSPAVRVQLPRHESEGVVPLTVEQVHALADAIPARHRAMVLTQAGIGLRIGELLALRVQDVDFLRRTVRVEWQFAPGMKQRSAPKTPRSRRTVPLPQIVADALARHIKTYSPAADGTLFTTRSGVPYQHNHYGDTFADAVERAGLPKVTSQDLRHHYSSVLLAGGEDVVTVAERLGHESAALVFSTYGHLMPGREERTRRAVDTAWAEFGGYISATSDDEEAL